MFTGKISSQLVAAGSVDTIRRYAAAAEQLGQLHPQQLKLIFEQNWFNLFVPRSMGGLELQLPEAVRLQEALALADGSVGWTVTLCSGANWFIGFLDKQAASSFFSDKQVCLAGSGAASGKAAVAENGYLINGHWKYATGAPYATAFTANCVIEKNGAPVLKEDGSPLTGSFIFKKEEVTLHNDWNTTGMKATASQAFSVEALAVPGERCFIIDREYALLPDPVFYFPFLSFAEVTLTANYSGMAFHFTDLCKALFEDRIKRHGYNITEACEMLETLARSKSRLEDARQVFYEVLEKTWANGCGEKQWSASSVNSLGEACRSLVKLSRRAVDELYPYCGMAASDQNSEINRVWRDFHTASLHGIFTFGCG
ncbi:acyl-CoA dehydrogenase [Agriterribacter sp.]|uniref:acyl-CoA dehydrogenase n=1 Tax=Agriterribacter sp. TaxID=2821509 RepID=UPI002C46478E|nr:acyl-CoA dehydrogenase [Agriterribacter sp.]HRP56680.1 acyl-CoA dehydrogenase [Agriterribacter sp.]